MQHIPQGAAPLVPGGNCMKRLPLSLSVEAIRTVWSLSRDSRPSTAGAFGIDGVGASVFASRLSDHILGMRHDIRMGVYRFSNLRMAPIEKPSGGYRIIAVPTVRDRLLQRALLNHLVTTPQSNLISTVSFGFTKGRSLSDAQRRAASLRGAHPWVLQADIVKFFDRIPRSDVKTLIRKQVRWKVIAELLCSATDCELEDGGGRGAEIAQANGIQKGLGLRQGMPVSPLLSNLLLKNFDAVLTKRGISAIRYADDIAVFADSKRECLDALEFIRENLAKLQLNIPELIEGGKTKLLGPSDVVEFLGIEIRRLGDKYKIFAPAKKLERIDAEMGLIASIDRCVADKINIGRLVRSLDSFVVGHRASMVVLDNADGFMVRLEAMKQKHLRRLLISVIGQKAVERLDDNRLAILGLKSFNG